VLQLNLALQDSRKKCIVKGLVCWKPVMHN
jgi:hypothetical protein